MDTAAAYCPKCGKQITGNGDFCKHCGATITAQASTPDTPAITGVQNTKSKQKRLGLPVKIIIAVLAAGGLTVGVIAAMGSFMPSFNLIGVYSGSGTGSFHTAPAEGDDVGRWEDGVYRLPELNGLPEWVEISYTLDLRDDNSCTLVNRITGETLEGHYTLADDWWVIVILPDGEHHFEIGKGGLLNTSRSLSISVPVPLPNSVEYRSEYPALVILSKM